MGQDSGKGKSVTFLEEKLSRLERLTSISTNPHLSITHVLLMKLRILIEFFLKRALYRSSRRRAKRHMSGISFNNESKIALVLGNGPSIGLLDFEKIIKLQNARALDVLVVNQFVFSDKFANGFVPNFIVLSDPSHRPIEENSDSGIWSKIKTESLRMKIVVPQHWFNDLLINYPELVERCYFFDDVSLEGFSRNIRPSKARGYLQFTAFKALAFACSQKYEEIGICGIDNTMFKALSVDNNNRIIQGSNHLQGTEDLDSDVTWFYANGVADYFYLVSLQFLALRKCFAGYPIKNLDPDSLIDNFDKGNFSHDVKLKN